MLNRVHAKRSRAWPLWKVDCQLFLQQQCLFHHNVMPAVKTGVQHAMTCVPGQETRAAVVQSVCITVFPTGG
jgi:hypothetical protein